MGDEDDQGWKTVKGRKNKDHQRRLDITTAKRKFRDEPENITTYFFTDIPNSFGAKAMFNAFQYYGDVSEVVIPAKRDRGGRRFGFVRFNQVTDERRFEYELDKLIIGRNKITVNLSRFQRPAGVRRQDGRWEGMKVRGEGGEGWRGEGHRHRSLSRMDQRPVFPLEGRSYAQAIGREKSMKHVGVQHIILSYEAGQKDMERLKKAFIEVVAQPGMSYNIQEAFHREGYFGVKITPLGSNLTLLEGQEDGEVEALMEDAKGWLDQWFVEIRPWSPNEIDEERSIWLRIYGVPTHAWNINFFDQVVKPWGKFIHADDGTSKKITMDVARILIRTSCQKVVDEFIDVKINGKIFHLRVLEDSYGPMRILIPLNKNSNGRDNEDESESEEEEERRLFMEEEEEVEEDQEREKVGVKDNFEALTPIVKSHNCNNNIPLPVLESNKSVSNYLDSNSNNINSGGGGRLKRGAKKVNSKIVRKNFVWARR
jgi:hypothetical protein